MIKSYTNGKELYDSLGFLFVYCLKDMCSNECLCLWAYFPLEFASFEQL